VGLNRRGPERHRTAEDTIELIRRLAAHHPTARSPRSSTSRAGAPAPARPSAKPGCAASASAQGYRSRRPIDPDSKTVTIQQAAHELGVSAATIRRWLNDGLLPAEQTTPHAPWRIRLTDEARRRFVPDVPDGFAALDHGA